MKFKEYVEGLLELMHSNPDFQELEVVYSTDDEGNSFQPVFFSGNIGYHNGEYHGEFTPIENIAENVKEGWGEFEDYPINAVCIN